MAEQFLLRRYAIDVPEAGAVLDVVCLATVQILGKYELPWNILCLPVQHLDVLLLGCASVFCGIYRILVGFNAEGNVFSSHKLDKEVCGHCLLAIRKYPVSEPPGNLCRFLLVKRELLIDVADLVVEPEDKVGVEFAD